MGEVKVYSPITIYLVSGGTRTQACSSNTMFFPNCLSTYLGSSCLCGGRQPKNEFLVVSGVTEVWVAILPLDFLVGPAKGLLRTIPFREFLDLLACFWEWPYQVGQTELRIYFQQSVSLSTLLNPVQVCL